VQVISEQEARSTVAVDSNGDSNRPGRGCPSAAGHRQSPEVANADGRRWTTRTELVSESSAEEEPDGQMFPDDHGHQDHDERTGTSPDVVDSTNEL
jgi:hypothetical protein